MTILIVLNDGTWLSMADKRPSNVRKLYHLVDLSHDQKALYLPGVGAGRATGLISKYLGGAFGFGAQGRSKTACAWLRKNWKPGDRIIFIGFSRGAATARMEAYEISENGIEYEEEVYYPDIDFLGCWDTVASFGIPINLGFIKFQEINLFTNLEIGKNVKKAVHLVALDENREAFMPTLMNQRPKVVKEIWVIGAHSDVGGGELDPGLSDITLSCMIKQVKCAGAQFKDTSNIKPNPEGTIHAHLTNIKPQTRTVEVLVNDKPINAPAHVHKSVTTRKGYTPLAKVDLKKVIVSRGTG